MPRESPFSPEQKPSASTQVTMYEASEQMQYPVLIFSIMAGCILIGSIVKSKNSHKSKPQSAHKSIKSGSSTCASGQLNSNAGSINHQTVPQSPSQSTRSRNSSSSQSHSSVEHSERQASSTAKHLVISPYERDVRRKHRRKKRKKGVIARAIQKFRAALGLDAR